MSLFYRFATVQDAEALLSIYAPYITDTAVTFECEVPSVEEFSQRVRSIVADYPYIVCVEGGRIFGYAYGHRQMERSAYQWNAELSVYIEHGHQHRGIGSVFYRSLIELLRLQNICTVYGGITTPNTGSERLHESLGFSRLGTYHHTGFKCGAWHDVTWFEKQIGNYGTAPLPFRSIRDIPAAMLNETLSRCAGNTKDA